MLQDCELLCPVCFEVIEEAYVTRCGHSFCFTCISKAVELHHRCPKCGATLASRDHIFPNFLLNEVVAKRRARGALGAGGALGATGATGAGSAEALHALVAASSKRLHLADVDSLLELLTRRKRLLQAESAAHHHRYHLPPITYLMLPPITHHLLEKHTEIHSFRPSDLTWRHFKVYSH